MQSLVGLVVPDVCIVSFLVHLRLGLSGAPYLHLNVGQLCTEGEGRCFCTMNVFMLSLSKHHSVWEYLVCGYSHTWVPTYTVGVYFQLCCAYVYGMEFAGWKVSNVWTGKMLGSHTHEMSWQQLLHSIRKVIRDHFLITGQYSLLSPWLGVKTVLLALGKGKLGHPS